MIAICNAHPPATSERSNTVPALAAQSVGGGAALRADAPDPGARPPCKRSCGVAGKSPYWTRPARRAQSAHRPVKGCHEGPSKSLTRTLRMSRVPSLSSPFLLGFDEIERALDRVAKAADGYPPYNIERIACQNSQPERLRITLAVAGFTRDQLDVTVEESQLVIRGRQQDDKEHHYLHRGIAARQFQRTFVLADGMEVLSADLKNGLLSIDLFRPQPERIVKTIDITDRD